MPYNIVLDTVNSLPKDLTGLRELFMSKEKHNIPDRPIDTGPFDRQWEKDLAERGSWWYSNYLNRSYEDSLCQYPEPVFQAYKLLHKVLISCGGHETCFAAIDPDIGNILEKGVFKDSKDIEIRLDIMEACHCHSNAAEAYAADPDHTKIWTGYVLSEDGMWRSHSWIMKDNVLVETTSIRRAYYGFELDEEQTEKFVIDNI